MLKKDALLKLSDADLMVMAAGEHNQSAFAALVHRHKSFLYTVFYRCRLHRSWYEDAAQDTWRRVWECVLRRAYREQGKFRNWLYGIARSCAIVIIRSERASRYGRMLPEAAAADIAVVQQEAGEDDVLPKGLQPWVLRIIHLLVDEHKTVKETAEELHVSENAVYKAVSVVCKKRGIINYEL